MQNLRFTCIGLVLFFGTASAQSPTTDSLRFTYLPTHVIKFSPQHLINIYPTFQIAYEYRIKNNFAVQLDVGYAIDYIYNDPEFQDKRGVKLKTEMRYYLPYSIKSRFAQYLSAEPYANIINFDREELQTECFDNDCTILYTRQYNYKVKYREHGISFKYGIHKYGRRVTLDVNAGLMLRFVDYIKPDMARGFNELETFGWLDLPNEDKRTVINPIIGGRIGYRIK